MKLPIPLRRYLLLRLGIVAAFPIVIISGLVWQLLIPQMRSNTEIQHEATTRAVAGQVSSHLSGGERQLVALSDFLQTRQEHSPSELLHLLDAQCGKGDLFEAIYIATTGNQETNWVGLAETERSKRGNLTWIDFSGRNFIPMAAKLNGPIWSETFLSTITGRLTVALMVPMKDNLIIGEISLDKFSQVISRLPVKSRFITMVLDQNAHIIADSQQLRRGQKMDLITLPGKDLNEGGSFSLLAFELDGVRMLGTVIKMHPLGWSVLVAQPVQTAYKPLTASFITLAAGLGTALLLLLTTAWIQAGRLSKAFIVFAQIAQQIAHRKYDFEIPPSKTVEFHTLGQSLEKMAELIRQREKALMESEIRLKVTLNSIGDAVIATDERGTITLMNPAAEHLTGWNRDDAGGRPLPDVFRIFNALTRKIAQNPVEKVLAKGDVVGLANHTLLVSRDGTEYQISDSGTPICQADGTTVGVVLVFRDVTEIYAKEQQIQENEKLLKSITQNVPEVIFQMEATKQRTFIFRHLTPKTREIFGMEPHLDNFFDAFIRHLPGREREIFITSINDAAAHCRPWRYEGRFIKTNGETIWFEGRAGAQANGETVVFNGVLMDQTRRYEMMDMLRVTQYSFDKASIGIYNVASNAQIYNVNEYAAKTLGYTLEELSNLSIFDIDPSVNDDNWQEVWSHSCQVGEFRFETTHRCKDGKIIPVEIFSSMIEYDKFAIAFVQDITERKQSEQALKESEERLDLALSGANEGIWDWHLDQGSIYFDARYYTMAGYQPYEFPETVDEWEKRLHKEDVERVKAIVGQYLDGNLDKFGVEFRYLRKDDSYMWIQGKGKIVSRDDQGTPTRFIGTHADITQRKQLEESLRITQFIFDKAPIGIWRMGKAGEVLDMNEQACDSLGYTREELCRMTVFDFAPGFAPEDWVNGVTQLHEVGTRTVEVQHQRKSGEIFPIQVTENMIKFEDHDFHVAFVQDITERKQNEEELHRLRNYLSNIIDSMPSSLIGVDSEGCVTQWNRTVAQATGVTADMAHGKTISDMLPWMAKDMKRISESIRTRQVIQDQKRPRSQKDQTCYENVTIYPLVSNGVEGAVIRIDDVTEKVKMEESLIQNEKMLSLGGLAAGMAHEINNPLAGIIQNADVLSNRITSQTMPANIKAAESINTSMETICGFMEIRQIPRIVESIKESGLRVRDIVSNMLNFARKSDSSFSTHDPVGLMDKILELAATDYNLKKEFNFKSIEIKKEYDDYLPMVACEGSKIQQVILNLLNNGAHAMFEQKTEITPRFVLRLINEKSTNMLRMEIEDNGPGMDEVTCKKIFEPFFTTKPVGVGTGLGLSVSYFIITENHGGTMDVISEPGKGTNFIIRLPLD